jgi:peptidoglycan/xylan/chitin deacetylase (PgdA/CDA1 family)
VALLMAALPAGTAAAASHSVEIAAPSDGATVGGIVEVVATTTGAVISVSFDWATSKAGPWTSIAVDANGSDGWMASWDTGGYDGPAILRATASDGATDVTDTTAVTVENPAAVAVDVFPQAFSPNGDGRRDLATIEASTDEGGQLTVEVISPSGVTKRTWQRLADPGEPVTIEWNGRADGHVVADAVYTVRATSGGGQDQDTLILDTRRPTFRWRAVDPEPLTNEDTVRFRFTSHDRADELRITLAVRDRVRAVGSEQTQVHPGRRSVAWRARYPGGGKLYPGLYTARITVLDDAGNVRRSRRRPWRVDRRVAEHVYRRLEGAGPRVALTFDDCHFAGAWREILDVLEARHLEATFFCPGQMMQVNAGLVERTTREGHTIASHGWDHALLTGHSVSFTARRLDDDARVAWQSARTTTWPYFRPPYGAYDRNVLAAAEATSHPRVMLWDVDPRDWQTPGASTIVHRVVSEARSGSIVVLHTLPQTADALPRILSGLAGRGLRQVDLPDLFAAAGYRPG